MICVQYCCKNIEFLCKISNVELFADNIFLFSVIHDSLLSAKMLNDGLDKINKWEIQWKMSFNLDTSKQAQEVVYSRTIKKGNQWDIVFNNMTNE